MNSNVEPTFDMDSPAFASDEFRVYEFKVSGVNGCTAAEQPARLEGFPATPPPPGLVGRPLMGPRLGECR